MKSNCQRDRYTLQANSIISQVNEIEQEIVSAFDVRKIY